MIYNMSQYTLLQVLRHDFHKNYIIQHVIKLQFIITRLTHINKEYYTDTDIMNKLNQVISCINDLNFSDSLTSSDVTTIQTTLKTTIDRFNSLVLARPIDDTISVNDIVSHLDELITTFNGLNVKVIPISPLV